MIMGMGMQAQGASFIYLNLKTKKKKPQRHKIPFQLSQIYGGHEEQGRAQSSLGEQWLALSGVLVSHPQLIEPRIQSQLHS